MEGIRKLVEDADYPRLKARLGGLSQDQIKKDWVELSPVQKLAVFKLFSPDNAMAFFAALDFEDKYLVFCGFDHGSIAPLTEALPPGRRALFEILGPDAYREMLRQLSRSR